LQNQTAKFFVFAVLIIYVMAATAVIKPIRVYIAGLHLDPLVQLTISLGIMVILGMGLIVLNKWLQAWLTKKND